MRLHRWPLERKPRILQLITDLEPGGAPQVVRNLALGLQARGYEVGVACLAPAGPVADELRRAGIMAVGLNAGGARDVTVLGRLARLLLKYRPDILHTHLMHANVAGRLVGRACAVGRIFSTIHTAEQGRRWHLWLENVTQGLTERMVCVSPSVRDWMSRAGIRSRRLTTICNAVEVKRYAQAPPYSAWDLELTPDKPILIFTGRLDPVKNLGKLLGAVKLLAESGRPVQLLIVGDGPMRAELMAMSRTLELGALVRFLGYRKDVGRLLRSAQVFVMASRWEGLSMSALEAMAAGVPVVVTRVPGLKDIVEPGRTGLLADPESAGDIAAQVRYLLDHPGAAQAMAARAQQQVWESYGLEGMIQGYLALYEGRLSGGGAGWNGIEG